MEDELKEQIESIIRKALGGLKSYIPIIESTNAILTLIRKRENVAYQQGIINAHKHDMFSAKACMEANEQQLKEVQGEVE